ncbi:MAG TPA: hypothetical protein VFT53_01435 [Candidatus Saccharimonadales bacterium]|nr:hypothetical protein [Candidatus Saccharimonadales bacterium]
MSKEQWATSSWGTSYTELGLRGLLQTDYPKGDTEFLGQTVDGQTDPDTANPHLNCSAHPFAQPEKEEYYRFVIEQVCRETTQ